MRTSWKQCGLVGVWWAILFAAVVCGTAAASAAVPPNDDELEDVADSLPRRGARDSSLPASRPAAPVSPGRVETNPRQGAVPAIPPVIRDERDVPEVIRPNLVQDGSFLSFQRLQIADPETAIGAWGTGLYSRHGLWWASGNAQVTFQQVRWDQGVNPPGCGTALEITNRSPAQPHVFGTTSQRILLEPTTGRYWISLWARASNLRSRGGVQVVVDRAWKARPITLAEGSYPWRYYSGVFDCADVDTAREGYVDLRLLSQDAGTVQVTDVALRREVVGESSRILALVVIDNDANVKSVVEADQRMVVEFLQTMFAGRGQVTLLQHSDATPANVLNYYRELDSVPNDTLFFFYAGHGATELQQGHALKMHAGTLYRRDLLEAIRVQRAQMKILVTDCCANYLESRAMSREMPRMFYPTVVHGLFLRQRGLVDMTASAPGEFASGNQYGGAFSRSLFGHLQSSPEQLDANSSGLITWQELFAKVRDSTSQLYRQDREAALHALPEGDTMRDVLESQESQTPYPFALDALPAFRLDHERRRGPPGN